jgi:hypothetical protein
MGTYYNLLHRCPAAYFARSNKTLVINGVAGIRPKNEFELKTTGIGFRQEAGQLPGVDRNLPGKEPPRDSAGIGNRTATPFFNGALLRTTLIKLRNLCEALRR